MPPQKAHKIDISSSYPCPCRRQGHLTPIILTEAFGCQRCQKIFVVKQDGQAIEQLSATSPYKQTWYWTGDQWSSLGRGFGASYWSFTLGVSVLTLILLLGLLLLLQVPLSTEVILLVIIPALIPMIITWLTLFRR